MELGQEINSTYRILGEIGSGGGGTVYKAYHIRLRKQVVLKKINLQTTRKIDLEKEAEILKNLHFPYLPQALDFLKYNGDVFTVMDFIPGDSFEQLIMKGVRFSRRQIIKYALQLCETLCYLHSRKPAIIHGDIKPSNIMLTPQDDICLIDFNISGYLTGDHFLTMGLTPGYASPEQRRALKMMKEMRDVSAAGLAASGAGASVPGNTAGGDKTKNTGMKVDERSDIYSFGATLYYIATGSKPEGGDRLRHPGEINPDIGQALEFIILKSMNTKPEERFQSAEALRKAIKNIYKLDRRYKILVIRQNLTYLMFLLFFLGGLLLSIAGWHKLQEEKLALYEETVDRMEEARIAQRESEFEELYQKAIGLFQNKSGAYYQKALYLYEDRDYDKAIEYITEEVLYSSEIPEGEQSGDLYFILANCYFELENYDHAITDFRSALRLNSSNPEYYRDYAISLARLGKIDEAGEVLEQAGEAGLSGPQLSLADGEVEFARGNYEQAEKDFRECIESTEDAHIKMRAYCMCDKVYKEMGNTEENYLKSVSLLEEAQNELPEEELLLVKERLIQSYINLGDMTGNSAYCEDAIRISQEVVNQGWSTHTTYNNMAVLYQKIGKYSEAGAVLQQMLSMNDNDYTVYKRLAFLEVDIQQEKNNQDRDYSSFKKYYDKAFELFNHDNSGETDAEMQLLEQLLGQLQAGGWL